MSWRPWLFAAVLAGAASEARAWEASAAELLARKAELAKQLDGEPKARPQRMLELSKQAKAPEWIKKSAWVERSGASTVYFAVGAVQGVKSPQLGLSAAINRARTELAKLRNAKVPKTKPAADNGPPVSNATRLSAVEIVDIYQDEAGKLYALGALSE